MTATSVTPEVYPLVEHFNTERKRERKTGVEGVIHQARHSCWTTIRKERKKGAEEGGQTESKTKEIK